MTISISNFKVEARPGKRVHVSGTVTVSTGNPYAAVQFIGTQVNAMAIANESTGKFQSEFPVDASTSSILAIATNSLGSSDAATGSVAGPVLSSLSLSVTATHNGDGTWTLAFSYAGTWTVDLQLDHTLSLYSSQPEINSQVMQADNSGGSETASFSIVLPDATSYSGLEICAVIVDSWGIPHLVACHV